MEVGQILHGNPIMYPATPLVDAIMTSLRGGIANAYWNVNQKPFYDAGVGDVGGGGDWASRQTAPPLGIPGMEWWPYYNWAGAPDDPDWDQAEADRPNFSFEGVEVRWYKYFGRSMNVNVVWSAEKWEHWFGRCQQTLEAWGHEHAPFVYGHRTPYPKESERVPIQPSTDDLRHVELMRRVETLEAQLVMIECVCIDVSRGEQPTATRDDWRWCHALEWVVRLGRHALRAPDRFGLHSDGPA